MFNLFFKSTIPLALYSGASKAHGFITKTYRAIIKKNANNTAKDVEIDPEIRSYKNMDQMHRIALKYRIDADLKAPHDRAALLELRHVKKCFRLKKTEDKAVERTIVAVDDVSLKLRAGETLGILGKTGSGKSILARTILKYSKPDDGRIIFDGDDITNYPERYMKRATDKVIISVKDSVVDCRVKHRLPIRSRMQMVMLDQYASLPERKMVGKILVNDAKEIGVAKELAKTYVLDIMAKCGLRDCYDRMPAEFSARDLQKISIARAIVKNPDLIVFDSNSATHGASADEQTLALMNALRDEMKLSYVFVSENPESVKSVSDNIGVICNGSIVEYGSQSDVFENPLHPYTKAMLDDSVNTSKSALDDSSLPEADPTRGCKFSKTCPYASLKCRYLTPEYREYSDGHFAACHLCEDDTQ